MKTTHTISRSLILTASITALVLVLAACGSSSSSSSSTSTSTNTTAGTNVAVALKDFSITMPKMALHPGSYTFDVTNNGPSAHNLTISGPGVNNSATSTFASGGTQKLTVTLQKGTYDFFCSVPGHQAAGMDVKVTVSA